MTSNSSSIPQWVYNFTSLTKLRLSYCNLTGSIPKTAKGNLCKLRTLDLSEKQLSDEITEIFQECSNGSLEELNLAENHLIGNIPHSLGNLKCLRQLQLYGNTFSGSIPSSVLPDDVAKHCLALVPRSNFPAMGGVCKRWRSFIQSKEFISVQKLAGVLEEWLYVLTFDAEEKESHWEVLDCLGQKHCLLPQMPGPLKAGFGVVVLDGKLLVMAGYSVVDGTGSASADVYQYDSCLNSWSKLANMNVARYDFACAEVKGMVYAVGGYGMDGNSLSSVEVYNPDTDKWTLIESLRRPRWGCFACGLEGKLYVMGGRSNFTIGNSKFVDVYNTERHTWCEMKNGCVMVTAHAVLGKKLFCMEWKNQRKLAIFNPDDNSWKMVPVPLTGSSSIGFRFGILDGKLLLFSLQEEPGYSTLLYDPNAAPGSEWKTSDIKPSGFCLCSVTIKV